MNNLKLTSFKVIDVDEDSAVKIVVQIGLLYSGVTIAKTDLPDLIAQLQEVANLPSIPALQQQLARVQEIARERGNENEALRKDFRALQVGYFNAKAENESLSSMIDYLNEPEPETPENRIANALERIADKLEDHLFVSIDKA